MDSKKIVENILKNNGVEWKVKDFDRYVDPKCKTATSIYSKLVRLYSNSDNKKEFTISNSGLKDLLRMTVIVEYSEIVDTIKKLKSIFPDLTGYLAFKDSGYCGIHLNLKIDGLPCEIQLAPKIVVMGVDYLHTLHEKWRDFDFYEELNELEKRKKEIINSDSSACEKKELLKLIDQEEFVLQSKIKEEKEDLELRKKTYGEIFNTAGLPIYQNDIMKAINELFEEKEDSLPLVNIEIINLFNENLLTDGKVDKYKVNQVTDKLLKNIELVQDKFVNLVKECLQL